MTQRIQFPQPSGDPDLMTRTRADADRFIAAYQHAGRIRRCKHVRAVPSMVHDAYHVSCSEDAFEWRQRPYAPNDAASWDFHGCPSGCRYYVSTRRAAVDRFARGVGRVIAAPFRGAVALMAWLFAPAVVRALLVLILIAFGLSLVSPTLRKTVLDTLKDLTTAMKSLKDAGEK